MPMIDSFTSAWIRSFDYGGRSRRDQFWWFVLANTIVIWVLLLISSFVRLIEPLANLYVIAQIVPHLPLSIRRLRDSGKQWPWLFIQLVPVIGMIWLIVLFCQPSVIG